MVGLFLLRIILTTNFTRPMDETNEPKNLRLGECCCVKGKILHRTDRGCTGGIACTRVMRAVALSGAGCERNVPLCKQPDL